MDVREIVNVSRRDINNISKDILRKVALGEGLNLLEMKQYNELKKYFKATNQYFFDAFNDTIKGKNYVAGYGRDIEKFAYGKAMSFIEDVFQITEEALEKDYQKLVKQLNEKYNNRWLLVEEDMYERLGNNINVYDDIINNGRDSTPNIEYRTRRDRRVRPLHRTYHGVVVAKSNKAWLSANWIFDHPGCRCRLIESAKPVNNHLHSPITNSWADRDGFGFIPSEEERLIPSDHPYMVAADDNIRYWEDFKKVL